MSNLTPEEKSKIYEEEKARLEARETLKKEKIKRYAKSLLSERLNRKGF